PHRDHPPPPRTPQPRLSSKSPEQTVRLKTSPKQRAQGSGWPAATIQGRKAWFPIDALETVRDVVLPRIVETSLARVHHVDLDGDPAELMSASEFRKLLDVSQGAWDKYVGLSKPAWDRDEDGYLPRPDDEQPAPIQGVIRYWQRRRIQEWINSRTGRVFDTRAGNGSAGS
ncbi:hypothetical protein, partial [Micromonospora sp. LOL_024]|uniref:hypothetical protein n=1 Tax=Micromonospora sp. LOL_024 TaxID=3345412 RepID=UPI003A852C14